MELKTYDDLVNLHSNYADTFRKRIEQLAKELPKSRDALVKAKQAEIKGALDAAKAAERSRDSLVTRANTEIARYKEAAVRLEREIEVLQKSTISDKPKPVVKPKEPARPAKPK